MDRIHDMHINVVMDPKQDAVSDVSVDMFREAVRHFSRGIGGTRRQGGVFVAIDPSLAETEDGLEAIREASSMSGYEVAYAPGLVPSEAIPRLHAARDAGVSWLKFHPYEQALSSENWDDATQIAIEAEDIGMNVMVCSSYGTVHLDRYDSVGLSARLSQQVDCPIVMSHAGGARVLDALLVAEDASNIYLETSFTLDYYEGSSVENDIAFAIRKLGADRWLFGSDAPFIPGAEAVDRALTFLDEHGFSEEEKRQLMSGTARDVLEGDHRGH